MSATSLDDTGYEDLPSDQDEEGSTSDSKSGNVKFAENEKVVSIDEIAKTEDVIMEKSVEDDIGQKSMEEDVMQKFVEDDVLKKSVDVTQKSVEEAVLETSIADYGGETSVEEYTAKSDDKDNEVFPRELLMNTKVVTPETKDIPTPSAEATTFFSLLAEEDLKSLIYKDSLITTSSDGDLGEFLISIDTCTFQEEECYNISAKSVGNIEGILCGTSLVAYVNKNLQTLEQRHHEYVELNPCPLDRKTLITRRNGLYIFTKTISEGQESYQIQKAWNINDLPILILEGANTLLLRILITKGAALKDFNVPTLDSDGYLCKSEYKSLGMRNIVINKEDINTIVLQRTIFSKIDAPISWNYNFMDDAHLLSRIQVGSHVRMRVTILPTRIFPNRVIRMKPIFKKQPLNLDEDMEMKSKFMDKKDKFMNDFSVYLQQKPEIRSLLADFLQFLLLRKPEDVVSFAAEYFSAFSTHLVQPPSFQTTKSHAFAQNAPLFKKL